MTTILNAIKLAIAIYRGYWFVRWSVNAGIIWYGFSMLVNWATTVGHAIRATQGAF